MSIPRRILAILLSALPDKPELRHRAAKAMGRVAEDVGLSFYQFGRAASSAADTLSRGFDSKAGKGTKSPTDTSQRGLSANDFDAGSAHAWYSDATKANRSRRMMYRDGAQMMDECPEIAAAIEVLASTVCTSEDGDDVTFSAGASDKTAQRIIDELNSRTKLPSRAKLHCQESQTYGDAFCEKVIDNSGLIWRLNELPTKTIEIVQTEDGRDIEYVQRDDYREIARWKPWEILHLRGAAQFGSPYGRSRLRASRKPWRQFDTTHESAILAVATRATQTRVHNIPVTDDPVKQQEQINDYIKRNSRSMSYDSKSAGLKAEAKPFAGADIINPIILGQKDYPRDLGVKTLDEQRNYDQIVGFLEWQQRRALFPIGVPPSFIGLEKETRARATIEQQDINFIRIVRQIQSALATAYKFEIYDLQFRLLGMNVSPDPKMFWVEFPRPNAVDDKAKAEILKLQTESAKLLGEAYGLPLDVFLIHFLGWAEGEAVKVAQSIDMNTSEEEKIRQRDVDRQLAAINDAATSNSDVAVQVMNQLERIAEIADFARENADPVRV